MRKHLCSVISGLMLMATTTAYADALAQLKSFLGNTQTVTATFNQVVQGKKKTNNSSGTFELLRPGKFRWEYLKPYQQLIVSDSKKVWVYDTDLEQVTERKLDQALGDTPAALLAGSNELEKGFSLKNLADHDGLAWVEALPKQKEGTFERIELGLQDNQLKKMVLKDQFGQTTTLDFANIVKNPKIDAKRFSFTPPTGADIIKDKE